jgi:menaquinone-dependent protoporphyrinogen oxidase
MMNRTRRAFMIDTAKTAVGAVGFLAFGQTLLAPSNSHAADIEFSELTCGVKKQNDHRVLVAYASRCGSTGEVAEKIGRVFCENGVTANVRLIENIERLETYHAVIIGSAVHRSQWLPEAGDFVGANRDILRRIPVAYFLTCLAMSMPGEGSRRTAASYLDSIREKAPDVQPVDTGLFAGVLDYGKLSWPMRVVMKRKMKERGIKEGDYRDWDAIRTWASGVRPKLLGALETG